MHWHALRGEVTLSGTLCIAEADIADMVAFRGACPTIRVQHGLAMLGASVFPEVLRVRFNTRIASLAPTRTDLGAEELGDF